MSRRSINLTNQRFGKLVALRAEGRDVYNNVLWVCRCDCGQERVVPRGSLTSGSARHCGCQTEANRLATARANAACRRQRPAPGSAVDNFLRRYHP